MTDRDGSNFIYVIRYEAGLHKIGISVDPEARLRTLQAFDRRPLSLVKVWLREAGDARAVEAIAHRALLEWQGEVEHSRERFHINQQAACALVEFAIAMVDGRDGDMPVLGAVKSGSGLPPDASATLIGLADLPVFYDRLGYIHWVPGLDIVRYVEAMRRSGVNPESIYCDRVSRDFLQRIAVLKDCREGDRLYVPSRSHLGEEGAKRAIQKGATIVEIDHDE